MNIPTLEKHVETGSCLCPCEVISPSSGHSVAKPERTLEFRRICRGCSQGPWDPGRLSHPHNFLWEIRFKQAFRIEGGHTFSPSCLECGRD